MTSYRPVDSKREEFRKYLEKAGAMDALTKVLVMLYDEPEKPADALDYIRKHLGDNRPDDAELNELKTDLEESRVKILALEDEIQVLKSKLAQYEPTAMEEGDDGPKVAEGEAEAQPVEGADSAAIGSGGSPTAAAGETEVNASTAGSIAQ